MPNLRFLLSELLFMILNPFSTKYVNMVLHEMVMLIVFHSLLLIPIFALNQYTPFVCQRDLRNFKNRSRPDIGIWAYIKHETKSPVILYQTTTLLICAGPHCNWNMFILLIAITYSHIRVADTQEVSVQSANINDTHRKRQQKGRAMPFDLSESHCTPK